MDKVLPNHIQEYLVNNSKTDDFVSLFEANESDVDVKTELSFEELVLVNNLIFSNRFLEDCGISDIYTGFIDQYLRLKISKDRASRSEFVNVNKREHFDEHLNKFNAFQNLSKVKE